VSDRRGISGVNIIDTAINYRCQRSERAIGRGLSEAFAAGEAQRDEVIVCTKAGYIPLDGTPPPSREEYQRYLQREYIEPGILSATEIVGGAHSLAPKFLEDQLRRSLENLRVDAVDYFYLHNPEQQLTSVTPDELYARVRAAFATLEGCVDAGKIGAYGCATWNGLRLPAESQGHLSLFRLDALAREVAGEAHHFRIVQLPVNLSMSEAVRVSTQRDPRGRLHTVLEAAAQLGIDVVASAPLLQGRLTSDLPESVRQMFPGSSDAQRALTFARSIPGILSVAVGTRQETHLEENLSAFRKGGR
jgi:aryl-alcohol dehydrogenase-like predicted oxidoreductase